MVFKHRASEGIVGGSPARKESATGLALFGLVFSVLLLFSAGCQTTNQKLFTVSGQGWRVQQGQALWRPGRAYPEVGGDLVLASHDDGRCLIQFSKMPISLVLAQTTRTNWLIEFPARRLTFSGHRHPSTRFGWLYLAAALSGQSLPAAFRFETKPDGGWRLENSSSGETIEGFLTP
jgi:hypothetical protein